MLREEIAEYRQQLKQAADELNKCQITIDAHVRTEEANKVLLHCIFFKPTCVFITWVRADEDRQFDEPSRHSHLSGGK